MDLQNLFLAILIAIVLAIVPLLIIFIKLYTKNTELNFEKQKIELDIFRQSLENSIYSTTEKLASNKERWEDVNHMLFEVANKKINHFGNNENQFLESLSIDRSSIKLNHNRAFLLAPINSRFAEQVTTIKEACGDIGIVCETADEEFISGPILSVIIKKMLSANLVIAIIDGRNPNVFYELGLAHAFGKTTVMITGASESIPFDIQSQRMVIVDWNDPSSINKIRKSVAESMRWSSMTPGSFQSPTRHG